MKPHVDAAVQRVKEQQDQAILDRLKAMPNVTDETRREPGDSFRAGKVGVIDHGMEIIHSRPAKRVLPRTALSRAIAALKSNGGSMLLNGEQVAGHSGGAGTVTRVTAATDPAGAALRAEKKASGMTGKQFRKFRKALRRDYKDASMSLTERLQAASDRITLGPARDRAP